MRDTADFWVRMQRSHIIFFFITFALTFLSYKNNIPLALFFLGLFLTNLHLIKVYDETIIEAKKKESGK